MQKKVQSMVALMLCLALFLNASVSAMAKTNAANVSVQDENLQMSSALETVPVNLLTSSERKVNFNAGWKFALGDNPSAYQKEFDDSSWRILTLPHDWSIEQPFTTTGEAESGFLPGGTGWYRKAFTLTPDCKDKKIFIEFGGVYMNASVYINGEKLGTHPYGYTPFSFDLSPYLICDGATENVVSVKVEHKVPSSRWYSGSGIYRSVNLVLSNAVHIARYGTVVSAPDLETQKNGDVTVNLSTKVQNEGKAAVAVKIRSTIYQKDNHIAVSSPVESGETVVALASSAVIPQEATVSKPSLWTLENPKLYYLKTQVIVGGSVVDEYETEFGFRYTKFDRDTGFSLNGQKMKLKGMCMHHDQGSLGAAAYYRAIERQVEILKEMGCNAIRVTHNPAADELIEICNKKGMLVIEEAFDTWIHYKNGNINDYAKYFNATIEQDNKIVGGTSSMKWSEFDLKEMVMRGRNAPSIIMWSIGNEVKEGIGGSTSTYPQIASQLCTWISETDSTRPATIGDNHVKGGDSTSKNMFNNITDAGGIVGVNYGNGGQFDAMYNKAGNFSGVKDWILYASETSSAVNSRGVYDAPKYCGTHPNQQLTAYDQSKVGWGHMASEAWNFIVQRDFMAGEFIWTGFDYIGEPTPWNKTDSGAHGSGKGAAPKSSYFGVIDTAGFPKDTYYFYQSQWNEKENTLHILPAWNENNILKDSSGNVEVVVYSDAAAVELFLNGKSLGRKAYQKNTTSSGYTYQTYEGSDKFTGGNAHRNLYMTWNVPYEAGTLSAKAYDESGKEIDDTQGRSSVETAGPAKHLKAYADRDTIIDDGYDLSYITVDVTDAKGSIVPDAANKIRFSVEGNGKIVGVDNGNPADLDSYKASSRTAFNGKALVIVQSKKQGGSFTVNAVSDGLEPFSVTVQTKSASGSQDEKRVLSYEISKNYYVKIGSEPKLPAEIKVNYSDGTSEQKQVTWENHTGDINAVGVFAVKGSFETTNTKGAKIPVQVNIYMIEAVERLLNYSVAIKKGTMPTLPASRPAAMPDGTLSAVEFPVRWDPINPADIKTPSTVPVEISGTSTVLGVEVPVKAYIRVADGEYIRDSNVAGAAAELTATYTSDNLEAVRDNTKVKSTIREGSNGDRWTNWEAAQAGHRDAKINFRYDTAQNIGEVQLYLFTDNGSARKPESIVLEYSGDGINYDIIQAELYESNDNFNGNRQVHERKFRFAPVPAVHFRVHVTSPETAENLSNNMKPCSGFTEIELYTVLESFPVGSNADLSTLHVNGKNIKLEKGKYEYSVAAKDAVITAEGADNAAVTVLPQKGNVIYILTEAEDHSSRSTYKLLLGKDTGLDAEDDSHDIDPTSTTATAGSEQPNNATQGLARYAIDKNSGTLWHTNWNTPLSNMDSAHITIDLGESKFVNGLRYQPRTLGGLNGTILTYKILANNNDTDWTDAQVVATGTWEQNSNWKMAAFTPIQARYIRLKADEAMTDQPGRYFASAAEIRITVPTVDISDATVTNLQGTYPYTSNPVKPEPTVVLNEQVLIKDIDYELFYENNIKPGKARMIIAGKGNNYIGTILKEFLITDNITEASITPSIDKQPTAQTVTEGSSAVFSVTASASDNGTLTYQWQMLAKEEGAAWVDISGATDATYQITKVALADSGKQFHCIVTNTKDSLSPATATSNTAELTVKQASETDKKIKNAVNPEDITVAFGTEVGKLKIPDTVTVTLEDDTTAEVPVMWNTQSYDGSKAGEYTFVGTLTPQLGIINSDNITSNIKVTVEEQTEQPSKEALLTLIATAKEKAKDSKYTETSRDALIQAIATAQAVADNDKAIEQQIAETENALQNAINALEEVQPEKSSKEALLALIQSAKEMAKDSKYTQASRDALTKAIETAQAVADNDNATEQEIADAQKTLQSAIKALVKQGGSDKPSGGSSEPEHRKHVEPNMVSSSDLSEKLASSSKGTDISVRNDYKVATGFLNELMKSKDKSVTLNGDWYSWTFDGKKVENNMPGVIWFDTRITTDSPNADAIGELTGEADTTNLYFSYEGNLPGETVIRVQLEKYAGKPVYVYYHNPEKGRLELIQADVKADEDGWIEFSITHCSDYVVSASAIKGAVKVTKPAPAPISEDAPENKPQKEQIMANPETGGVETNTKITVFESTSQVKENPKSVAVEDVKTQNAQVTAEKSTKQPSNTNIADTVPIEQNAGNNNMLWIGAVFIVAALTGSSIIAKGKFSKK